MVREATIIPNRREGTEGSPLQQPCYRWVTIEGHPGNRIERIELKLVANRLRQLAVVVRSMLFVGPRDHYKVERPL